MYRETLYIIGQILGFIIAIENFFIFFSKKRDSLIKFKLISDAGTAVQNLFLGLYTGMLLQTIAFFREIVFYQRNRHKWAQSKIWLYFFMIIMGLAPVITWEGWISLIPAFGSIVSVLCFYVMNPHVTRMLGIVSTTPWLIYSIIGNNYGQIFSNSVVLFSIIIGLIRDEKEKEERAKEKGKSDDKRGGVMLNNLINPYIRLARGSVLGRGVEIKTRIIFDYELIYIQSGMLDLTMDGKVYRCEEGDFLLIHPKQRHSLKVVGESVAQPHIHFDLVWDSRSDKIPVCYRDYNDLTEEEKTYIRYDYLCDIQNVKIKFENKNKVLKLFFNILKMYKAEKQKNGLYIKAKMTELIHMIIVSNAGNLVAVKKGGNSYDLAYMVKGYIDANFFNVITLDSLELYFCYNKYYLSKVFSSAFGCSIIRYYNDVRLLEAKRLLKDTDIAVNAVSAQLNFSSVYVFSHAYKNKFGISPVSERMGFFKK